MGGCASGSSGAGRADPVPAGDAFERVAVRSRAEWRDWLGANHRQTRSIWLVRYKAGHPDHVTYDAAVEEALCFGWVDSLPRKLDAERSMLLMSPRKNGSAWSALNKRRVAAMEAAGLMAPAGSAAVEAAKANGMWTFLDDVERLEVPDDLAAAFGARPGSRERWDAFPPSARRGILEWIKQAKRADTRARRIERTAVAAARGERAIG